jgi:O-antigen ligase
MLLILAVPAIARVIPAYYPESLTFYGLQLFITPFLMYIVGIQLGRNLSTVRRVLAMVSGFGALVAAHTILVALTGIFLLKTQHEATYLGIRGDFVFTESNTSRVGSFLLNPDWNGTFLMIMACITAGLFIECMSRRAKLFYALELALILPALLFTYSLAALAAGGLGLLVLVIVVGRHRHLIAFLTVIGLAIALVAVAFPGQLNALQQHASNPREGSFRLGVWLTALRVIAAYPITGVGLSQFTYLQRAEPYRVPMEFLQESHPHESYLELAAMAGIPLLVIFLVLLGAVMRDAIRSCRSADKLRRPLLAGAVAAVAGLALNSLAINAWTLPPLAAIGWFIAGLLSSPMLTHFDIPHSRRLYRSAASSRHETTARASR